MIDLPTIWLLIIALEIGLYIMFDGMDLGIGVLTLFHQEEKKRDLMIQTIGPIWTANETWLVVASGTLFGAFPLAYGIILNALYIPVAILLLGLVVRAVCFEFRHHAMRRFWEYMFGVASLLIIIGQGCIAGGILNGITVVDGKFAGGNFDWFSPLSIHMTIGILMSYVVVGYAYLIKKSNYELHKDTFFYIVIASLLSFVGFFAATLLLPQMFTVFAVRWTTPPTNLILFGLGACIAVSGSLLFYGALRHRFTQHLYTFCMLIFIFAGIGMLIASYPFIIPPSITIFDAAASTQTLSFMLWGIGPLLPLVFLYNFYLYRVFRKGPVEK